MKNLIFLSLLILAIIMTPSTGTAQCSCLNGIQDSPTVLDPSDNWQTTTYSIVGSFKWFELEAGTQYIFSTCPSNTGTGGSGFDPRSTLYDNDAPANILASNCDSDCGLETELVFTANTTSTYRLGINAYQSSSEPCGVLATPVTVAYKKVGSGGGGTTCDPPDDVEIDAIGQDFIELDWGNVSDADLYQIRFKPSSGTWIYLPETSTSSITIESLNPGTTYQLEVASICSGEYSEYSDAVFATTSTSGGGGDCPAVSNLNETGITESYAQLHWDLEPDVDQHLVQIRVCGDDVWEMYWTNNNWYGASNLLPNTCYDWFILSYCSNGSAASAHSQFMTNGNTGGSCGTTGSLTGFQLSTYIYQFNWVNVSGASSYLFQYQENGGGWNDISVSGTSHVFNMNCGSDYVFQVRAVCGGNIGEPGIGITLNADDCGSGGYPDWYDEPLVIIPRSEWLEPYLLDGDNTNAGLCNNSGPGDRPELIDPNYSSLQGFSHVLVHHSAGQAIVAADEYLRSIYCQHITSSSSEWNDIAYNFGVSPIGEVFELRGLNQGAAFTNHNSYISDVCFLGHFGDGFVVNSSSCGASGTVPPSELTMAALESGVKLVAFLVQQSGHNPNTESGYNVSPLEIYQKHPENDILLQGICGHQDGNGQSDIYTCHTECPGKGLYNQLDAFRQAVVEYLEYMGGQEIIAVTDMGIELYGSIPTKARVAVMRAGAPVTVGFTGYAGYSKMRIYPGLVPGDTLMLSGRGYYDVVKVVTADDISSGNIMAILPEVLDYEGIKNPVFYPSTGPLQVTGEVSFLIDADNATSALVYSEDNWLTITPGETILLPVSEGDNYYQARLISPTDTVWVTSYVYGTTTINTNFSTKELTISADPEYLGARLFVNNNHYGEISSPETIRSIPNDKYELRIRQAGYADVVIPQINSDTSFSLAMIPKQVSCPVELILVPAFDSRTCGPITVFNGMVIEEDLYVGLVDYSFSDYGINQQGVATYALIPNGPVGEPPSDPPPTPIDTSLRILTLVNSQTQISPDSVWLIKDTNNVVVKMPSGTGLWSFDQSGQILMFRDMNKVRGDTIRYALMKQQAPIKRLSSDESDINMPDNGQLFISWEDIFIDPDSIPNDIEYWIEGVINNDCYELGIEPEGFLIEQIGACGHNVKIIVAAQHDGLIIIDTIRILYNDPETTSAPNLDDECDFTVTAYPNYTITNTCGKSFQWELLSLSGKTVKGGRSTGANTNYYSPTLTTGIYVIRIFSDDEIKTEKVFIK